MWISENAAFPGVRLEGEGRSDMPTHAYSAPHFRDRVNQDLREAMATYRLPFGLEPEDNPGREPKVILRSAGELGDQVVRLNQAPMNPVEHLRIDAASEC